MKVKYYKDTNLTIGKYALMRMMKIFGVATPIERVAEYFKFPKHLVEHWEKLQTIPDEDAYKIIEILTGEKPEEYVTEKSQSIDFILNA